MPTSSLGPIGHVRQALLVLAASGLLVGAPAAFAASGASGTGFRMPSKLVTCAFLPDERPAGLYCGASYIEQGAYDGVGVVHLPLSGKASYAGSGNDIQLRLGGWTSSGKREPRPTLAYGSHWQRSGYRCTSRMTGLECKRGSHGFFLSKERIRLY